MIEGNGPKWLFDIYSLTQSMNYIPVTVGTSEEISQDCIVMPIWKDTSYFDSPTKDVENGEPDYAQKQVDSPNNENVEQDNPDVNTGSPDGTIKEEVYVSQPLGFKDPDHPDKVYKVVKALYGLHQAPRAWYETLANYLLSNGFKRGKIDQTLFIKKQKRRYFACTAEILKKFNYSDVKSASTPIDLEKPLVKDGDADDVDVHLYRSMIGSLMYLTASRPDIMFALTKIKYIRNRKYEFPGRYVPSDYAGATLDRKSTTGGCQFLGNRLISWQCKKQTVVATSTTEAEYVVAANLLTKGFDAGRFQYLVSINTARQKITTARQMLMLLRWMGTKVANNVVKFLSLEALFEGRLVMRLSIRSWVTDWKAATTASSLEAEQDSDTISGGDVNAQTRFEITSKQSIDPPLSRGYTLGSGDD
ncbi:putative ribonuclease H-like domain-containing protein, partial [Tanacetum coccineum]